MTTFEKLVAEAKHDPNIIGLWLGGSRGKGLETLHSDFDCLMIVADDAVVGYRERFQGNGRDGVDCQVMTLGGFAAYGDWDGSQRWDRYNFAHTAPPLVDKTGKMQSLINENGYVPAYKRTAFIDTSIDHFINQVYRVAKCQRDGLAVAARIEAASALEPLLDAVFALDGGRLRPFAKYLAWALRTHPLGKLPWEPDAFVALLLDALSEPILPALQELLTGIERLARTHGHDAVFDAWGQTLDWMRTFRP